MLVFLARWKTTRLWTTSANRHVAIATNRHISKEKKMDGPGARRQIPREKRAAFSFSLKKMICRVSDLVSVIGSWGYHGTADLSLFPLLSPGGIGKQESSWQFPTSLNKSYGASFWEKHFPSLRCVCQLQSFRLFGVKSKMKHLKKWCEWRLIFVALVKCVNKSSGQHADVRSKVVCQREREERWCFHIVISSWASLTRTFDGTPYRLPAPTIHLLGAFEFE